MQQHQVQSLTDKGGLISSHVELGRHPFTTAFQHFCKAPVSKNTQPQLMREACSSLSRGHQDTKYTVHTPYAVTKTLNTPCWHYRARLHLTLICGTDVLTCTTRLCHITEGSTCALAAIKSTFMPDTQCIHACCHQTIYP